MTQSISALDDDVAVENLSGGLIAAKETNDEIIKELNDDAEHGQGDNLGEVMQTEILPEEHLQKEKIASGQNPSYSISSDEYLSGENENGMNNNEEEVNSTEKIIFLLRHAESEENVQMAHLFNAGRSVKKFHVPLRQDVKQGMKFLGGCLAGHYDAPLSEKGRQQSQSMGEILSKERFLERHGIQLIVHSPLERARDTCKAMLGQCSNMSLPLEGKRPIDEENTTSIPVYQLDCLQEATPFEQVTGKAKALGPRVREFEDWIAKQKETTIAVVGHSQYFMLMLGMKEKFQNCDVWKASFQYVAPKNESSTNAIESNQLVGKATWQNLTMLHRYDNDQNPSIEEVTKKSEKNEKEDEASPLCPCQT